MLTPRKSYRAILTAPTFPALPPGTCLLGPEIGSNLGALSTTPSLSPFGFGSGGPTSSHPMGLATATFVLAGRRQRTAARIANAATRRPGTRILMYAPRRRHPAKRSPENNFRASRLGAAVEFGPLWSNSWEGVPGDR